MQVEFEYSIVYDLVYHILAHIKVNNPSDLYSKSYIDKINEAKCKNHNNLEMVVPNLEDYYNKNFDRLGIINFLPLYFSSSGEFICLLKAFEGFTSDDKEQFVIPFCQAMENELDFYESYWNEKYNFAIAQRKEFEAWMSSELAKYQRLFTYFNKKPFVALSFALTCNGRGFGSDKSFNAAVPFPTDKSRYKDTFFQIIHEYTHQFTDILLESDINMKDGSHDSSEKSVILFDYYLIKSLYPNETDLYLEWIGKTESIVNCDETLLLSIFKIDESLNIKLLELARNIVES